MIEIINDDCLNAMEDIESESIDFTVTSPPYYNAREYAQYQSYQHYLDFLKDVFLEVKRITKNGRFIAVNLSNVIVQFDEKRSKPSTRFAIPYHFVNVMESIGWTFVDDIIWQKPDGSAINRIANFHQIRKPMTYKPNIVTEFILIFQKPMNGTTISKILSEKSNEITEQSLINGEYERTNVWYFNPETALAKHHSAPFPEKLSDLCIQYYSFVGDTVFDPFLGSGTSGVSAVKNNRNFIGIERDKDYHAFAKQRIEKTELHTDTVNSFDSLFN